MDAADRILDTRLIAGIEISIYQARVYVGEPGVWHGHIVGSRGFSDDDVMDLPFGRPNKFGNPPNWVDVGYCATEADARRRVAAVVGHIYGRRLCRAMGPIEPVQRTIPALRTVKL